MSAARILLLFAHPAFERSRVNQRLLDAARGLEGVTIHDLYEAYPDFDVDVEREQALLLEHELIVFQHPFLWYSAPALLREWQDLVLLHGWAHGRGGDRLEGKLWLSALTTGAPSEAYGRGGEHHFTVEELLRPFEATARLCGMRWLAPWVLHGTHLLHGAELDRQAERYREALHTARTRSAREED